MNRFSNIIIASRKPALWFATAVLAVAPSAFAHTGFNHVMGTVAKLSGNVLILQTAKGEVDMKLSDRTVVTRNGKNAHIADLKPGERVVAEVSEKSKDNVAQSVKIGAAAAVTSQARHK